MVRSSASLLCLPWTGCRQPAPHPEFMLSVPDPPAAALEPHVFISTACHRQWICQSTLLGQTPPIGSATGHRHASRTSHGRRCHGVSAAHGGRWAAAPELQPDLRATFRCRPGSRCLCQLAPAGILATHPWPREKRSCGVSRCTPGAAGHCCEQAWHATLSRAARDR